MPCSDGGPSQEDIEFERKRQRGLAVGLCLACSILDKHGVLPDSLREWQLAHLAADETRDWLAQAHVDRDKANKLARDDGMQGLGFTHPLSVRVQNCYAQVRKAEESERFASAKLSSLKPE